MPIDFNPINQFDQTADMESTYLKLPFEEALLAAQEINRQNELGRQRAEELNILGKNIKALEWDKPIVHEKRKAIYNTVDDLINQKDFRSRDYNDRLFKAKRDIQNEINYGELGAAQQRYDEYQAEKKRIQTEEKNAMKQAFLIKQLEDINSKDSLKYDSSTGQFNHIQPPHDWEDKDPNKTIEDYMKSVNWEQDFKDLGIRSLDDFNKAVRTGTNKELLYQKLIDSAATRVIADDNLKMSSAARANWLDKNADSSQEFSPFFYDKNSGHWVVNPKSKLGQIAHGTAQGMAFKREERDDKLFEDYAAKQKLDNDLTRYSTLGLGINPQTVEKSSKDLDANILNLKKINDNLISEKSNVIPGSPEDQAIDSQIAWNKMLLNKKQQLQDKAETFALEKEPRLKTISEVENNLKAIAKKYNINYEDAMAKLSGPNSRLVDQEFTSSKDRREFRDEFLKHKNLLTKKSKYINDYLKNSSESYTIQPSLITVDNTRDMKTSTSIETLYNDGIGSWQVFDENGPVVDPDLIPKHLKIKQITEQPVDELGYLFSGVEEVKDSDGKPTGEQRRFYIKPTGQHNINEKIGKDLIDENSKQSDSQSKSRYQMGLNMVYPEYANQVSQIRTGYTSPILRGKNKIADVEKTETNHGTVYKVKAINPTTGKMDTGSFNSEEDLLKLLNILSQ